MFGETSRATKVIHIHTHIHTYTRIYICIRIVKEAIALSGKEISGRGHEYGDGDDEGVDSAEMASRSRGAGEWRLFI